MALSLCTFGYFYKTMFNPFIFMLGVLVGHIKRMMKCTLRVPVRVPSRQVRFLVTYEYAQVKWIFKFLKRRLFCFVF